MAFFSVISLVHRLFRKKLRGAGLESTTLNLEDGTSLHLWVPVSTGYKAPPDAPALVLIHGFGVSSLEWAGLVKDLVPHFRLYLPDLVFMGESTTTSIERSEIFQAESVVKALQQLGVTRFSALGTSYGGFVLYRIAQRFPEVLEKAIFSDSGVTLSRDTDGALLERTKTKDITELLVPATPEGLRVLLSTAFFKGPPLPNFTFVFRDYVKVVTDRNREQKCELLRGMVLGSPDAQPPTPITHESLIIWGDKDQIFPLPMASELQGLLPQGTRIAIIKDTGHVPQEESPKEYTKELLAFLLGKPQQ